MPEQPSGLTPNDRLVARIVLRLTDEPDAAETAALGDEDLAALIDERLQGRERDRVLAALDRSPDAYLVWLAATANRGRKAGEQQARRRVWARRTGFLSAAIAACLLLAVVVLEPGFNQGLDGRLDVGFAALKHTHLTPRSLSGSHYGFADGTATDALTAAIQAGYRAGRAAFVGTAVESRAAGLDSVGYQFGRWIALLEAGADSQPPPTDSFWADQRVIAQRLADEAEQLHPTSDDGQGVRHALKTLGERLHAASAMGYERWRHDLAADILRIRLALGLFDEPRPHSG